MLKSFAEFEQMEGIFKERNPKKENRNAD